jgi:hypothetical protein
LIQGWETTNVVPDGKQGTGKRSETRAEETLEEGHQMHAAAAVLSLVLASGAGAQTAISPAQNTIEIRSLTLVSADLTDADRGCVVRSLRGQPYSAGEFEERVRLSLRDLGYYSARVEDAELTGARQGQAGASADVAVKVEPGALYRIGVVVFHHATLFPPEQLRSQFTFTAGSLFNATSIGYGLWRIRNLYEEKGYIDFGAIPTTTVDEAHHIVNLTVDMDEGKPYVFGNLLLDGAEPRAGAEQQLIAAWATLQGKTYNPDDLKDWLTSNWAAGNSDPGHMVAVQNDPRQINLRLRFPNAALAGPARAGPR